MNINFISSLSQGEELSRQSIVATKEHKIELTMNINFISSLSQGEEL
jgi:hypothetical protein